ncbi:MAG: ATP-binding cassette domain-containing protein [Dermatophilaceae bacterium]
MEPLLDIAGLHQFRGQRHVLRGVDLGIRRGEILGLIGRNGSGKSTLIKAIAGEVQPRSGTMRLEDESYRPRSRDEALAAGVSVIEQDFTLPADQSVVQAMYRHTFMAEWEQAELLPLGADILRRTHFELDLTMPVADLDPAEQSLAEVLRVLAEEAQLVIFDEVSALLNDLEITQLHHASRSLRQQGCAVLHIAHRLEEVTALCDRVAVLRDGVVVRIADRGTVAADELVLTMLDRPLNRVDRGPRTTGEPVLTVRGLGVPRGRLRDVELAVHAGEVMGVIGLRQSGAVELVEALAGRAEASAESVEIDGKPMDLPLGGDPRVTYVAGPAPEAMDRKLSDVVTESGEYTSEIERLRDAIKRVSQEDLTISDIQAVVHTLSGGDQQKIAVAKAATTSSRVVILNHPTRSVDIAAKERTYGLIGGLAADGRAVVVLSVDVSELLRCCDCVAVVHRGSVVAVLDTAEADEDLVMGYALSGERPARTSARGSQDA